MRSMSTALFAALAASALLAAGCKEAPPSSTTEGPANSAPSPVGTPTGGTSTGAAGSPSDTATAGATGTGPTGGSADATSGIGNERAAEGTPPADASTGARGNAAGSAASAGTTMDNSTAAPPAPGAGSDAQSPRATPSGNNITAGGVTPSVQPAPAASQVDPSALALADQNFLATAATSALFELDAARSVAEHGARADVKNYAAMLVKEHTAALDELRALAAKKKVSVASEVAPERKPDLQQLLALRGADFDRRFLQSAIDGHKIDIDLYEKTAGSAQDADVKAYAKRLLPKLRQHLAAAQKLSGGTSAK